MATRRVQTMPDDLKNIEFETSEDVDVTPTFDGMGLREELLRGIYSYGMHFGELDRAKYEAGSLETKRRRESFRYFSSF